MAFRRGDVVLIPFPHTDFSATKARPAVVVSIPEYQRVRGDLILAYLTSQTTPSDAEFDYLLVDWAAAGLFETNPDASASCCCEREVGVVPCRRTLASGSC